MSCSIRVSEDITINPWKDVAVVVGVGEDRKPAAVLGRVPMHDEIRNVAFRDSEDGLQIRHHSPRLSCSLFIRAFNKPYLAWAATPLPGSILNISFLMISIRILTKFRNMVR